MKPVTVLGVDPGPTTGLGLLQLPLGAGHEYGQLSAGAVLPVVLALLDPCPGPALIAVEAFVVGRRAGRSASPDAGRVTRELVAALRALAGPGLAVVVRPAAEVKPWATDERLRAAGLHPTGMPHARDGCRHALYAAVHDCGVPDPLSRSPR